MRDQVLCYLMRDQVLCPHIMTDKIIVLYALLIFTFLHTKWNDKDSEPNVCIIP